jgi:hypothetical protein
LVAHVTDTDIDRFCARSLPADVLVRFADHLAVCDACRRRTAARRDGAVAEASLQAAVGAWEAHVPGSEIRAFVAGSGSAERRREIAAHLDHCSSCAEDVRDLRALASEFEPPGRAPSRLYAALALAAALVLAAALGVIWRMQADRTTRSAATPAQAIVAGLPGVDALTSLDRQRVLTAVAARRLALPADLASHRGRPGMLRGAATAAAFHVIGPRDTGVLDDHPTLRWTPQAEHARYTVTIQNGSGEVVSSPPITGTAWTVDRALTRGQTYTWQVAAAVGRQEVLAPAPPEPVATFTVLDDSVADHLRGLPASPLVRGILYAESGAFEAASEEFRRFAADGGDTALADIYLRQLRNVR